MTLLQRYSQTVRGTILRTFASIRDLTIWFLYAYKVMLLAVLVQTYELVKTE